jgi:hypothetical protein
VWRAAWKARIRVALSVAGMTGMIGSMAIGGVWYVAVHLPATAAAIQAERLAAETLLGRAAGGIDGERPDAWQPDGAVALPVVMISRDGISSGRWEIRRD